MIKKVKEKNQKKTEVKPKKEPAFFIIRKEVGRGKLTFGQRAADFLTKWAGSWAFIILVGLFIATWIYLNVTAYVNNWDPWPFIILNLCLSCLAALQAPIILMSQNRAAERDRIRAEYDYSVNRKAEREIRDIKKDVASIKRALTQKK